MAATEPGYALNLRHQQKLSKYGDKCLREGLKFCPIVFKTTGGWHPEAQTLPKRLGVSLARASGGEEGEVVHHLFDRLSVILMRANATLLLNRVQSFTRTDTDGHL